mgnify:CR=1 FL=1
MIHNVSKMRARRISKRSTVMLTLIIAGCASAVMKESVLTKNDAVGDCISAAELRGNYCIG